MLLSQLLEAKGKHTPQGHPEWCPGGWGIYIIISIITGGGAFAGCSLLSPLGSGH